MIDTLTAEQVLDAAIRIQVCEKKYLEVNFSPDQVRVHLPPKRAIAEYFSVPVSKITAVLSEMERDNLIGTEQRGSMWANPPGNRIISDCLARTYRKEAEAVLGPVLLEHLLRRLG
jgi:hypothetical protein